MPLYLITRMICSLSQPIMINAYSSYMSPEPIENLQDFYFPRVHQHVAAAVVLADLCPKRQDELLSSMLESVLKEQKDEGGGNFVFSRLLRQRNH